METTWWPVGDEEEEEEADPGIPFEHGMIQPGAKQPPRAPQAHGEEHDQDPIEQFTETEAESEDPIELFTDDGCFIIVIVYGEWVSTTTPWR